MSLTIVLSGPKSAASQARNALASSGFGVTDNVYHYGLAPSEGEPREFVHALGDDIDKAHGAVAPLGYRLTLHYETPEASAPSIEQQLRVTLAEYERRLAALEAASPMPPIRGGAVESPGWANQNSTYGAEQTRRAVGSLLLRGSGIGQIVGGAVAQGDCALSAPGSGMSVNVAPGEVWVPGSNATQGGYYCRVSSTSNLAVAASNPTNPRIDRVSALITDSAYLGATNTFAVSVATGTPTAGANLTNLSGAPAFPNDSITLGFILVPASSSNVTSGDLLNDLDVVALQNGITVGPWENLALGTNWTAAGAGFFTPAARFEGSQSNGTLNDLVRLTGTMSTSGSPGTTPLATVAADLAPNDASMASVYFNGAWTGGAQVGVAEVASNGQIILLTSLPGGTGTLSFNAVYRRF